MTVSPPRRRMRLRRLVLGAALAAGVAVASLTGSVAAPDDAAVAIVGDAAAAEYLRVQTPAAPKAKPPASDAAAEPETGVDAEVTIGEKGVVIKRRRGNRDAEVMIGDREFDSFEQFVEKAPWLAGLVFMVTALFFLVPLVVIVLIIWYKMRSNRLRNETMLKLAERGVVAPAAAIDAMATTPAASTLQSSPATAPLYEQAKAVQRRAAWSDLRKGVILIGVGLGLTLWGVFDDGTPNGFGLIALFVGIGYAILWHFEQRQTLDRSRVTSTDTKGGP